MNRHLVLLKYISSRSCFIKKEHAKWERYKRETMEFLWDYYTTTHKKSVKNIQLGEQWNDSWTIHSKNKVFVGVIIMDQIITCTNQLDNFYKIIQEAKLTLFIIYIYAK